MNLTFVVWSTYWLPILLGQSRLCCHPVRDVRISALSALNRLLFLPSMFSGQNEFILNFNRIIFPLSEELLRPEVRAVDPSGIDDMRTRLAGFLCNYFLQNLPQLLEWDGLILLWTNLLEIIASYVRTGNETLVL